MVIRLVHLIAMLAIVVAAVAKAETAPTPDDHLILRAFGDSAYVAANGAFGPAPQGWVEAHLAGVEALRSPDVNFLNLEGALTRTCKKFEGKSFAFAVAPETAAQFVNWGFNLLGLANNHALDCLKPTPGTENARALKVLKSLAPAFAAHGVAADTAHLSSDLALLEGKGITLGMVAIKAWDGGAHAPIGNIDNHADVFQALADAAVDIRILSMHGGEEGWRSPTGTVVHLAHEFIDRYNGDIVFAHHPHKTQGFEVVRKSNGRVGVIFYSLGNNLHNGLSPLGDGMVASVGVSRRGVDPTLLAAYPLSGTADAPKPVDHQGLNDVLKIWRKSIVAINRFAVPSGLKRLPFRLTPCAEPVLGLRLDLEQALVAERLSH